jgi:ketosteroid isomerase-like protein
MYRICSGTIREEVMDLRALAEDFVALYNAGHHDEIARKYWSEDVVSIENMEGPMARIEGKAAVQGKSDWWFGAHEVHSTVAEGPFLNGDQFGVRFTMDITVKESGERSQSSELALYTVRNGKIVEERFFY